MKRQKMNFSDLINMNVNFHDFHRVHDSIGNKGTRYILSNPLTDEQIKVINNFKNTIISSCQYRYAPEIKYTTLIILDKCKKVVAAT